MCVRVHEGGICALRVHVEGGICTLCEGACVWERWIMSSPILKSEYTLLYRWSKRSQGLGCWCFSVMLSLAHNTL